MSSSPARKLATPSRAALLRVVGLGVVSFLASFVVAVPSSALKVSGKLTTFSKQGDSGKIIHRRFCPECGSGLMDEAKAMPDAVTINVGTLDERSWVAPQSEIYCDSAQHWVRLSGERKRFAKTPG